MVNTHKAFLFSSFSLFYSIILLDPTTKAILKPKPLLIWYVVFSIGPVVGQALLSEGHAVSACPPSLGLSSSLEAYTHVALSTAIGTEVVWNEINVRQRLPPIETVVSQEWTLFECVRFQNRATVRDSESNV